MKKVLLFPGIDALDDTSIRQQCMHIPEVVTRIAEAQSVLNDINLPINLAHIMTEKSVDSFDWVVGLSLAAMATQVGIFDRYLNDGHQPDALLSMSQGDLARAVCAGVGSFKEVFMGLVLFAKGIKKIVGSGLTYQVTVEGLIADWEDQFKLEEFNITTSVYQTNHANLYSGSIKELKQWLLHLDTIPGLKYQSLSKIPVALHHESLKPVALSIQRHIQKNISVKHQRFPIYSTVYNKYLVKEEELIEEMTLNIYGVVHFKQSIQTITKNESIEFLNIGPAATLLSFIKQILPEDNTCKLKDYFNEIVVPLKN